MTISEICLTSGVLILVIALIRKISLNRMPKKAFVILWELAILRLLIPVAIPAELSFYTQLERIFPKQEVVDSLDSEREIRDSVLKKRENLPNFTERGKVESDSDEENIYADDNEWTVLSEGWRIVRISVGLIMALCFATVYIMSISKLKRSKLLDCGYPVEFIGRQKLLRKVKICLSNKVASPLTFGIFIPVIILPGAESDYTKQNLAANEKTRIDYVLTHELVHIKRFDGIRKIIAAVACCVNWYNPAVWILYILYNRDIELSCDEEVVTICGRGSLKSYAKTLIDMRERQSKLRRQTGFVSPGNNFFRNIGFKSDEERILAIMNNKKLTFKATAAALAVICSVGMIFATTAAASDKDTDDLKNNPIDNAGVQNDNDDKERGYKSFIECTFETKDVFTALTNEGIRDEYGVDPDNEVDWWTEEDFAAMLEETRGELDELRAELEKIQGNPDEKEKAEELEQLIDLTEQLIFNYEDTLELIKEGYKVSKNMLDYGDDGCVLFMQSPDSMWSEQEDEDRVVTGTYVFSDEDGELAEGYDVHMATKWTADDMEKAGYFFKSEKDGSKDFFDISDDK